MKTRPVKTTYLEMREEPSGELPAPAEEARLRIEEIPHPTLAFYRFLYENVGEPWGWVDRSIMPDGELFEIISHRDVHIYVLSYDGVPAGFSELDRRTPGDIELAYFGLMREFIGMGLGKHLLQWTVRKAWAFHPNRLWLHTCELDHHAALPNYLKAGFAIYDERVVHQTVKE